MADDLEWMIARETPNLRRFARALVKDRDAADDLVQDSVERALRKRHLWRPKGNLRSWLYRLLYNVYLNGRWQRRRQEFTVPIEQAGGAILHPPRQDKHMECRDIAEALERLPQEQRDAILLVGLEGLPYDEAAWVLGVPIGTLRSRLLRARDALWEFRGGAMERPRLRRVK